MTDIQHRDEDQWQVAEGEGMGLQVSLRYRSPLPAPEEVARYDHSVRVLWNFGTPGEGTMPDADLRAEMDALEHQLQARWEADGTAIMVAVITFDGTREWVFYTPEPRACLERLNALSRDGARYPVELSAHEDAGWHYVREELLGGLGFEAPPGS